MAYYLDIFSPETYEAFTNSDRSITGFRERQHKTAERIQPGDIFLCYMTKLSRWFGVLEVKSECFIDHEPRFYPEDDPFIVRFKVNPLVWLDKEKAVPIYEDKVWLNLSLTRDHQRGTSTWTGKFRSSLTQIPEEDGKFIENMLQSQTENGQVYPVDPTEYEKYLTRRVRRQNGLVAVTVPQETEEEQVAHEREGIRESLHIQARLAQIGEGMNFTIWLPRNDRGRVLTEWQPKAGVLLEHLPLNYDEVTLKTIEMIDVLWLRSRSIVRAFEVEHTTAVYSGLLRMADLLALQPNMDIKLHIVAPYERREKVFQELQRPVFSLLDRGPLSQLCTYLSYDSVEELAGLKYLAHLSDSILDEYEELAE